MIPGRPMLAGYFPDGRHVAVDADSRSKYRYLAVTEISLPYVIVFIACLKICVRCYEQGSRHEVLTRGTGFRQTGTDSGESKPPTPNSDFSSYFDHFIWEISENLKNN